MIKYNRAPDPATLQDWPFDNPESDYVIRRGAPRASGRIDDGGAGDKTRTGIWRCTAGAVECTELSDELMTVLEGRCTLTDHGTGQSVELGPGDTLFIKEGARVTWDVHEDLTKVFYGFREAGF